LDKEIGRKRRASIEEEDDDNSLTGLDIAQSLGVGVVDDKCPFDIGDTPMARNILCVGANDADRRQLNVHHAISPLPLRISASLRGLRNTPLPFVIPSEVEESLCWVPRKEIPRLRAE
jgi:hypothetical protein